MNQLVYLFFIIFAIGFLGFSVWVFNLDKTITIDLLIFSFDVEVKKLYLLIFIPLCFIFRALENDYRNK